MLNVRLIYSNYITSIRINGENVFNCHNPKLFLFSSNKLTFIILGCNMILYWSVYLIRTLAVHLITSGRVSDDCVIGFLTINGLSITKKGSIMGREEALSIIPGQCHSQETCCDLK